MEVKRKITLISMTPEPGKLIEQIAAQSYRTQRFYEKIHPKLIKFASGRTVPFDEFGISEDEIKIGEPLPGYTKDDVAVAEIIEPSYVRVVKFVLAIGHHALLRNVHACFLWEGVTRKAALHFLRYGFINVNMQSQKYKNQGDFEYVLPERDEAPPGAIKLLKKAMESAQSWYEVLRRTGLDPEWSRAVYPNNTAQTMTFETNFEQYRHIFDCLCDDDYVDENQKIAMDMLKILKREAPEFFHDFVIRDDGKSAYRSGSKYSRNKKVNWTLPVDQKAKYGIEVPVIKGKETDIP